MLRDYIRKELFKISPGKGGFSVEIQENPAYGDYSSNIALVLAKSIGRNPRELAIEVKKKLESSRTFSRIVSRVEAEGPGFLNFFIKKEFLQKSLSKILEKNFGVLKLKAKSLKLNLEFVSANPTGPLTMANGRGGFYGDVLANVLSTAGYEVTREYYVNDAGNQIKLLEETISGKELYYKGEYVEKLKGKTGNQAIAEILKWIKKSLKNAGIKFDVWFSEEKNLRKKGELQKVLAFLKKRGLVEHKDGAMWLGDAVLVKSDGEPTYFLADLAYHYDKFLKRKFDLAIDVWGADHHGYAARMKNGIGALGIHSSRIKIIVMQLVRLTSGGKEVRMSKREGEFITLDELIENVGLDAARWFFSERSPDTHLDFDLDLAKERSKKNPVYYVQYAHARACSILKKIKITNQNVKLTLLNASEELNLIKKMLQFPEVVEDIARDYQVHRLTKYAYEFAKSFTNFYEKQRVISKDKKFTQARLMLVLATQKTLKKCLDLMGINAPNKM